ncbi:MAG: DOMON-like domain-containing protein [Cyanobacteria bacterium P01_G01_bin.54]
MTTFPLAVFDSQDAPEIQLTSTVEQVGEQLAIAYAIEGDLSQVKLPVPHNWPKRQDNLWQTTCFELFLAQPGQSSYWEVNLLPSGDWNVYHFDDYRTGMQEEENVTRLRSREQRDFNWLQVTVEFDLSLILPPQTPLELGICAVVERRDRVLSYWAIQHPQSEADFHARAGFIEWDAELMI